MPKSLDDKLRILPLGGLGEIGMNCLVLEWEGQIVLVDCGIQFPDASYSGVELLMPDLNYVRERLDNLLGVVVTHGHDDHIGAIPLLSKDRDLDVYSTPFPRGLLENKLSEVQDKHEVRFHEIKPREVFELGPFKFDPIPVQHSIIESVAFAIETPVGTVIHTGDFKHDTIEVKGETIGFEAFEEWGKKGVRLLLSDSTNAERAGHTVSENEITASFEQLLAAQSGRILVALFASNIRRIERIMGIAKKLGRKVALCGRSMHTYTKLAHDQSTFDFPEDTLITLENIGSYPDNQVLILTTGSQAEPQSALVRVSQGIHKDVQIKDGDVVILSSRFIPGNEKNISSMIDHLYRLGAEVIYESIHQIHVSGHGYQDELLMMLGATKPQCFIPVHGEYRHLAKHAKLALSAGVKPENIVVVEDGQVVELTKYAITLGEKLELKKLPVVGGHFMQSDPALFTQRGNLAKTGIVFVTVLRDKRTKGLVEKPRVSSYGILLRQNEELEAVLDEAEDIVDEVCQQESKREDLGEIVRLEMRRFYRRVASHKPIVLPFILDV